MSPTPLGTIAHHLAPSPPDDRTFRRRRLASLTAVLAVVVAIGSLVGGRGDDVVGVTTDVAGGSEVVQAASIGTATGVRELRSETTTTLAEATGDTTTTTTEAQPAASATTTTPPTGVADTEPDEPEPTTTTAAPVVRAMTTDTRPEREATTTTVAPRREPPTTTAAPRRSPPTTAAPAPPTTAPPQSSTPPGGGAYDDPASTQVWYDLAQCESGGGWSIDTGNGYYGGLQFSLGSWQSVGGSGYPHEHAAATQIDFGRELQARQGWGAWPHCSDQLGLR